MVFCIRYLGADPGDKVEVHEPIAQIETDKVLVVIQHDNVVI